MSSQSASRAQDGHTSVHCIICTVRRLSGSLAADVVDKTNVNSSNDVLVLGSKTRCQRTSK